jgi:hypothetical protein
MGGGGGQLLGVAGSNEKATGKRRDNVNVKVNVNEPRLGFSNTTRNPEGVLSHNNSWATHSWRTHSNRVGIGQACDSVDITQGLSMLKPYRGACQHTPSWHINHPPPNPASQTRTDAHDGRPPRVTCVNVHGMEVTVPHRANSSSVSLNTTRASSLTWRGAKQMAHSISDGMLSMPQLGQGQPEREGGK